MAPGKDRSALSAAAAELRPMKAVADALPRSGDWAFEIKWDGMRVQAEVHPAAGAEGADGSRVRLRSGRGTDVTLSFPELAALSGCVGGHAVLLDGEVVAMDDAGVPSFARMQQRMHITDARTAAERAVTVPVAYLVFDLLHVDGRSLVGEPFRERRALLEQVLEPAGPVQLSPVWGEGGDELLEVARQRGLEGVVAKRWESVYRPGRRSPSWRKVKVRNTQEFVVVGWLPGTGAREATVGSLVLGCHRDGELVWVGNVGTGFSDAELSRWKRRLAGLATDGCPLDTRPSGVTGSRARWVQPVDVVQVEFGEWTPERRLRHPAYLGWRDDKAADEVTCEEPST